MRQSEIEHHFRISYMRFPIYADNFVCRFEMMQGFFWALHLNPINPRQQMAFNLRGKACLPLSRRNGLCQYVPCCEGQMPLEESDAVVQQLSGSMGHQTRPPLT